MKKYYFLHMKKSCRRDSVYRQGQEEEGVEKCLLMRIFMLERICRKNL